MPTPHVALPLDLTTLPFRIATPVVLAICGYGRVTLMSRIKAGTMPAPIDRGRAGLIWRRDDVLRALKLIPDPGAVPEPSRWDNFDPVAFMAIVERDKADRAFARKMARMEAKRLAPPPPKPKVANAKLPPRAKRKPARGVKLTPTDLGHYIKMTLRASGRFSIYFNPPARYRPEDWPGTIRLPISEPRTGDMTNAEEVARIREDAATLLRSFREARGYVPPIAANIEKSDARERSIMKQLGPYVVIKPRVDGTYYVYQFVPLIHRAKGWKSTIPLPLEEPRTGDLRDRKEFKRIQVDAAALHRSMMMERAAEARQGGRRVGRKRKKEGPDTIG